VNGTCQAASCGSGCISECVLAEGNQICTGGGSASFGCCASTEDCTSPFIGNQPDAVCFKTCTNLTSHDTTNYAENCPSDLPGLCVIPVRC
jgi:hypothetical protein